MSENPRLEKSRAIYELWRTGEGDMGELAIGLYDLMAHYEALLDDYEKLEAKFSKMGKVLGDGGDLEYAANLLQEATNDHGIDQSFDSNPYDLSDRLHKMAEALAGGDDE